MLAELEARLRSELYVRQPYSPISDGEEFFVHLASTTAPSVSVKRPGQTYTSRLDSPLVYWGYLVKNQFMAGELYGLSWKLVEWIAEDEALRSMTKGKEDKLTAKWMRLHPTAEVIQWRSEKCWIYDHPRAGTVYVYLFH